MRERRLGDLEQRLQLADADLAGVEAQDVEELQADGIAERLGDLSQTSGSLGRDLRKDKRLTTRLAGRALVLGRKF